MLGLHVMAGYGVAALIVFRVVWGMFGSHFSRLDSFAFGPRAAVTYLRRLPTRHPDRYLGHNPAAAVVIFALLTVLAGIVAAGIVALGGEEMRGPMAGLVGYTIGSAAKHLHAMLAYLLLGLIGLHVTGVVVESVLQRDNLIMAMIRGSKTLPAGAQAPVLRPARPRQAVLALAAIAGAVALVLLALSVYAPDPMPPLAWNAAYRKECGACHMPYHPSLLPASSWRAVIAGLPDHFGDDASEPPAVAADIEAWLVGHAGETWDTEAAVRLRAVDPAQPQRITATPFWKRAHRRIPAAVFARKSVVRQSNCAACHSDADSGIFEDDGISIPGP